MRKFVALVSLLSLLLVSADAARAQLRSRRVGDTPPPASTPRTAPPPSSSKQRTEDVPAAEEVDDEGVVRVQTALVTIPVSVMDRAGKYVPDLRQNDFRIFENGVEQEVAYFAAVDVPFTVALLLDTSNSTAFKLEDIHDAAIAFVNQLRPEDRVLVVSFDSDIHVLAEPTSDRSILRQAIRSARTGGSTRLYDAVDMVMKQRLSRIKGRKAIVLFTDGVDTTSTRASYESNVADAEELDAIIYPVQYDTFDENVRSQGGGRSSGSRGSTIRLGGISIPLPFPTSGGVGTGGGAGSTRAEYERANRYLNSLADMTGGRLYEAFDLNYLARSFEAIAEELRRQYSLGYYPKAQSQVAERRQIKVRVNRPNLAVRARDSYIYNPNGAPNKTQDDARRQPELRKRQFMGRDVGGGVRDE
ncbi:MAG TPA: VWA domain-containing protein [Pyrinomonadaceae bacterium]|jgi:VWFA-related protein|nr:VWA domain-containing protein [Pyrinomonadaceae bacterium]